MIKALLRSSWCRRAALIPLIGAPVTALTLAVLSGFGGNYNFRPLIINRASVTMPRSGLSEANDLHLITFNIWGLPGWINGASAERYPRISHQLERLHPDIVLLQEVWTDSASHAAPSGREWWTARSAGQDNFFRENGLLTISRRSILGGGFHPFHVAALPDSLVKKGALKVTIELAGGAKLNVWNVHLQADNETEIRTRQIGELIEWVRAARDGQIADLVAGDFNSNPESAQYQTLLKEIGPSVQLISHTPAFTTYDGLSEKPGAGQTIDHAFLKLQPNVNVAAMVRPVFTAKHMSDRLSDHLGVDISLRFSTKPSVGSMLRALAARWPQTGEQE